MVVLPRSDSSEAPSLTPIDCAGDHYQMGLQQGEACRDQNERLHEGMMELSGLPTEGRVGAVLQRAAPLLTSAVGRIAKALLNGDLRRHYPYQLQRIEGIAAGSQMGLHRMFVGPGVEMVLNRVSYRMPRACTAFAVTGSRASAGEPMIAKNFDYPDAARDAYLVRRSRPIGGAASIDVTATPLAGSHEGINEHGLAIAYNYGFFSGKPGARVTITNVVQEILEQCRTVSEALAVLRRSPRSGGAILMIADADGDLASVEVAPDHIGVRRAADHDDWLAHANHAVTDEITPRDVPHEAIYARRYPKGVRGARVHESSEHRHSRAEQLIDATGTVTEADLERIIADHGVTGAGDDNTICRHGEYYETTCSVLLFPRRRTMKLMFGAPCVDHYVELGL